MLKNMNNYGPLAWLMAIAIAGTTLTACSSDEPEKPFTTDPVEKVTLYACGINPSETRAASDEQLLFTEDDIEWFNATTREIKFRPMHDELFHFLLNCFTGKVK